ncbi:MAG: T9SS type A sorting domain-containing protein [Candidatus Marinimicrobia bacterium]|nr:T9SS type A sorting domain-containing protein [Candidatus Neomarinimicrobiota bacterium]MCF7828389.1 T9SS type A sorting domain-containing protein [Candidatus Neomarinimicrobiota bacterium]MCF7881017.1 T9SS type A sorting domain-containing protein [Candidatus Neomarinimicrobiota bacterium]
MRSFALLFALFFSSLILGQTAVAPSSGDGSSSNPYEITSVGNLYWIGAPGTLNGLTQADRLGKHYRQMNNIDLTATHLWDDKNDNSDGDPYNDPDDSTDTGSNDGWKPIGSIGAEFRGVYDGNGYTVQNLVINRPLEENIGFFGSVRGGTDDNTVIRNLGIVNATVVGKHHVGSLIGGALVHKDNDYITIVENCYVEDSGSGSVTGLGGVGGLLGDNNSLGKKAVPIIRYCYAKIDVASSDPANTSDDNTKYGGLVGCNQSGMVSNCYATGDITGGERVGGIDGCTIRGLLVRSYSTGSVTSGITSANYVGGLVGRVVGQLPPSLGGFSGKGAVPYAYWNTETSGISTSAAGTGIPTSEMENQSTFDSWDFDGVWKYSTVSYTFPRLQWEQDGVLSPLANTHDGILYPTVTDSTAQPAELYSTNTLSAHNVNAAFLPNASETQNVSIYANTSTNPDILGSAFSSPENLGAYYQFIFSDASVLENGHSFSIECPVMPGDIWYRYAEGTWAVVPTSAVSGPVSPNYTYTVNVPEISYTEGATEIEFAMDSGVDSSLPVSLSSFTGDCRGGHLYLHWTTESEIENLGFLLHRREKTTGGSGTWETIASFRTDPALRGQGTTPNRTEYIFTDNNVNTGTTYQYQLGDVDFSGKVSWHDIIELRVESKNEQIPGEFGLHQGYPNPFNPKVTLRYDLTEDAPTALRIYDLRGHLVETLVNIPQQAGRHSLSWQPTELSAGIYIIHLQSGNKVHKIKVVYSK